MEQRYICVEKCQRPNGDPVVLKKTGQVYRVMATTPKEGFEVELADRQVRTLEPGNLLFEATLEQLRQSGVIVEIVDSTISKLVSPKQQQPAPVGL